MIQTEARTFSMPAALPLSGGGLLFNAEVAYELYGPRAPENTLVLLHDFTDSHRALDPAGAAPALFAHLGWAQELIGEDKAIAPHSVTVLSVNLLGSPFGTTSAASIERKTGQPIGADFPAISVEDMARAVATLLRGLSIDTARCVLGVGLGGLVALRLATLFPSITRGVCALGTSRSLPDALREHLVSAARKLRGDGEPVEPARAREQLAELRLEYLQRMFTRQNLKGLFADLEVADRLLRTEANAFAQRFDPIAYATLAAAFAQCDLRPVLERLRCKVLLLASDGDELAPLTRVRETYHALTASGVRATFHELASPLGHAGLLTEGQKLRAPLAQFLGSVSSRRSTTSAS